MGIVHAIQKGDMPASKAKGPARSVARSMSPGDARDFAETKHKGLPEKSGMSQMDLVRIAQALS